MSFQIAILEDDAKIAREVIEAMETAGYQARAFTSLKSTREHLSRREAHVLIVDLGLPDGSGLDLVKEVRKTSDVGVIVVSGISEEAERVAAIELGADDYLTKPFSLRELTARVRRLLERTGGKAYSSTHHHLESEEIIEFNGYLLNTSSMMLCSQDGIHIPITLQEFIMLRALLQNPGRVLSRETLLNITRSEHWFGSDRTVDNLISRLRKKIGSTGAHSDIKTVRGVGYMYTGKSHVQSSFR